MSGGLSDQPHDQSTGRRLWCLFLA